MAAPRVNRTAFAVLGYLTCWGPMSGYEIKKAIEGGTSYFWAESYGQIYPILKRLDAEGLARAVSKHGEGARGKRVYEVTAAGRKALDAWLLAPTETHAVRDEFLLKIFFGKRLAPDVLRRRLEEFRIEQQLRLDRYALLRRGIESSSPYEATEDMPYWRITLRSGERATQAKIDWCNETIREIDRIEAARGRTTKAKAQRKKSGSRRRTDRDK